MSNSLRLTIRSARLVLWPAIIFNCSTVSLSAGDSIGTALLLSAALSLVASFGFILNDLADVDVDAVNGGMRLQSASADERRRINWFGLFPLCSALLFAASVSGPAFLAICFIAIGLVAYTFVARRRLFVATLLASLLGTSPLWLSNAVFLREFTSIQLLLLTATVVLFMGREIVFDAADEKGDLHGGRRTLATVFGKSNALSVSLSLHIIAACLLSYAVMIGYGRTPWGPLAVIFAAAFVAMILVPALALRWCSADQRAFSLFTWLSRAAMLLIPIIWLVA